MTSADGPLLLCYDGSAGATHAIERAAALLAGRDALVLTVWQPTAQLGSFAWAGATESMVDFFAVDRAAADVGGRVADEGMRIARAAGLNADRIAVQSAGPVWQTIVTVAEDHQASMIVVGSRGLSGLRSMLLGSVSTAVLHHADRPTLVIRQPASN
jgi:nucleotide-binding universal stress UspA family protein